MPMGLVLCQSQYQEKRTRTVDHPRARASISICYISRGEAVLAWLPLWLNPGISRSVMSRSYLLPHEKFGVSRAASLRLWAQC